jgi:hypothetical protein
LNELSGASGRMPRRLPAIAGTFWQEWPMQQDYDRSTSGDKDQQGDY